MTDAARHAARDKARAKNLDGWLLTLDFPSYDAIVTYLNSDINVLVVGPFYVATKESALNVRQARGREA